MSEERGFEVKDRRRVRPEGEQVDPAVEDEASAAEVSAAHEDESPVPDGDMSVAGILGWTVSMLGSMAWIHMGLLANPVTGKVEKNLPEARRAIDALADLVKHVEAAQPSARQELQNMLSDLRINFVRQSNAS